MEFEDLSTDSFLEVQNKTDIEILYLIECTADGFQFWCKFQMSLEILRNRSMLRIGRQFRSNDVEAVAMHRVRTGAPQLKQFR